MEAKERGYAFDKSKIQQVRKAVSLTVTTGQIEYEWKNLLVKLKVRSPAFYQKGLNIEVPVAHPMFNVCTGDVELWERY